MGVGTREILARSQPGQFNSGILHKINATVAQRKSAALSRRRPGYHNSLVAPKPTSDHRAGLAQLVESLSATQIVGSSSLPSCSILINPN